jgi:hypothetical protein
MHSPTTMLACVDGMSEECQKILNDINAKSGLCVRERSCKLRASLAWSVAAPRRAMISSHV